MPFFKKINDNDSGEMTFVEHLEALRWHIIRSLLVVIFLAIFVMVKIDWFFDTIILGPLRENFASYTFFCKLGQWLKMGKILCMPTPNVSIQVTSFGSQFMNSISIAVMSGLIIGFPYLLWEIWRFIKPALSTKEIKNIRGSIFWISLFFFLGCAFGYFVLAPFTFSFLSNYKLGAAMAIETKPTLDDYIENMIDIIIGSALSFQLPIFSYIFSKMGLITPTFLKNYRKYAIVGILLIAAIITPSPDLVSQLLVATPLLILYEVSIYVSRRVTKEQAKKDAEWS